jgi:hypothetical protein
VAIKLLNGSDISPDTFYKDIFQKLIEKNKSFKRYKEYKYNQSDEMRAILKIYESRRGQKDANSDDDRLNVDEDDSDSEEYFEHSGTNPTNGTVDESEN